LPFAKKAIFTSILCQDREGNGAQNRPQARATFDEVDEVDEVMGAAIVASAGVFAGRRSSPTEGDYLSEV
jgi:hypothetical protein